MNSLEALKLLSECANGENKLVFSACLDLEQTIKQDLERLQQLKQQRDRLAIDNGELVVKVTDLQKENKELIVNKNVAQAVALNQKREIAELKDQVDYFKEDSKEWQSAYEWSQAQNAILKLKIKELEEVKNEN